MPASSENGGGATRWGSLLVAVAATFAVGGFCGYFYRDSKAPPPSTGRTEKSSGKSKTDTVEPTALGRIEPKDGILFLGVPMPDRIDKILVHEGEHVTTGKELVKLESATLRRLEEESSEIQRKEAKKRLDAIQASGDAQIQVERLRLQQVEQFSPLELRAQESKINSLEYQVANAEEDFQRLKKSGDSIAAQRKDKQRLLWQQAQEELTAARMQKQKLRYGQPLDVELAKARMVAAKAELERSQSAISLNQLDNQSAQAKARLQTARITAPCGGTVLRLLAREGDLVQGKPIVQMANLDKMIVVAEVPIDFIPRIREKDPATITSSVFAQLEQKELSGEVYAIEKIAGKPEVASLDPLASVDYRIVRVKILLHQSEPAARYIGHEVTVKIHPQKQR